MVKKKKKEEDEIVVCPRCDSEKVEFLKSWSGKSGRSGVEFTCSLYYCEVCRKNFRKYGRVE